MAGIGGDANVAEWPTVRAGDDHRSLGVGAWLWSVQGDVDLELRRLVAVPAQPPSEERPVSP